jgi:protein-tyrosine-phosphatase
MGEAVLAHVAKERGIDIHVESAGTAGYHVGEEPDERSVHTIQPQEASVANLYPKGLLLPARKCDFLRRSSSY